MEMTKVITKCLVLTISSYIHLGNGHFVCLKVMFAIQSIIICACLYDDFCKKISSFFIIFSSFSATVFWTNCLDMMNVLVKLFSFC